MSQLTGRVALITAAVLGIVFYVVVRPLLFGLIADGLEPMWWHSMFDSVAGAESAWANVAAVVAIAVTSAAMVAAFVWLLPTRATQLAWMVGVASLLIFAVGFLVGPVRHLGGALVLRAWLINLFAAVMPALIDAIALRVRSVEQDEGGTV